MREGTAGTVEIQPDGRPSREFRATREASPCDQFLTGRLRYICVYHAHLLAGWWLLYNRSIASLHCRHTTGQPIRQPRSKAFRWSRACSFEPSVLPLLANFRGFFEPVCPMNLGNSTTLLIFASTLIKVSHFVAKLVGSWMFYTCGRWI